MKTAAKKWYNYLIIVGITAILLASAYLPYRVLGSEDWPARYVCYFLIFSGIVVAFVGFIIQDIYKGVIRHKINDWTNRLDKKYENKAWAIFYPMLLSGFLTFIIGIVANFFVK